MATAPEVDESILEYNAKTFNDYMSQMNSTIADMDKIMNKELYESKRPDSIINRVFVDVFGVVGLYLMLFILSDITRSVLTGSKFLGIKWLFWGPYYYITDAPLLTRVWESKKFLKDLAEVRDGEGFSWDNNRSCSQVGDIYLQNCNEQTFKNHPIRDKMGDGLDWFIRHTIGKHFGGLLGSSNCTDQSTTIADDCAWDRVQALWAAYNGFCDIYPTLIYHRATDINWPNTVSMNSGDLSHFTNEEKAAYQMYFDGYTKIYNIGSTVFTGHGTPSDLIDGYDGETFYCYNANKIWGLGSYNQPPNYAWLNLQIPSWYPREVYATTQKDYQMYFQLNYKAHRFDV